LVAIKTNNDSFQRCKVQEQRESTELTNVSEYLR